MFHRFCSAAGNRCKRGAELETLSHSANAVDRSEANQVWSRHFAVCQGRATRAAQKAGATRRAQRLDNPPPPKPEPTSADRMRDKLAHATKMHAAWTRKRDMAENKMKKWGSRVKRYATLAAKAKS